ncbi:hypothetical protein ACFL1Y_00405 [Patescibacteria group bacterium]
MEIKEGKNRKVIIVNGLAIKFAKIKIKKCILQIKKAIEHKNIKFVLRLPYSDIRFNNPRKSLFKGIMDNFSEFLFFIKKRYSILAPTYFSFFSLVNIQKAGKKISINKEVFRVEIEEKLGSGNFYKNPHTFRNKNNFCILNNQIKIHDYADKKTQKVLDNFRDRIF